MPRTVLGLDLGSYSVKGALFDTTFRSYTLTDLFESAPLQMDDVAPEDRSVVLTEAVIRLIQENSLTPSTVVTALPGTIVSTRIITLPLPAKQVEKVLPFELESQLPFGLEELLVDAHIIQSSKTETVAMAAAVQKTAMAEHLALLKAAGQEPAFVTLDSLALLNLHQLTHQDRPKTYAVADIGHQKTSLCIISDGQLRFVRTLYTAGAAITAAIRDELDLTLEQALEVKHSHAILELEHQPLRSKDLRRLSAAIRTAVDPLLREILQTFHSFRAQFSSAPDGPPAVEHLFLCGGSSLIRNFPEYIQTLTNVPASRLRLFPEDHPVSEKLNKRESFFAQAVALGLRASSRGTESKAMGMVNFRKDEFAFARNLGDLREKAMFFTKWVALVFILALVHMGMRYESLSREHGRIEKEIMQIFKQIAPDEKKPPKDSNAALTLLREKIRKYESRQEVITSGLMETTALGILREVSEALPADARIDAQELSIDRNKVTIRANTDSIAAVDRVIAALSARPHLKNIEKGDIREAPDGRKAFQLTITIGEKAAPEKEGKKR